MLDLLETISLFFSAPPWCLLWRERAGRQGEATPGQQLQRKIGGSHLQASDCYTEDQ